MAGIQLVGVGRGDKYTHTTSYKVCLFGAEEFMKGM